MPLAKVWNDHTKEYKEKFREDMIVIPPKGYVEMDQSEARIFMGQFVPIKMLDSGEPLNPKMLRLEIIQDNKPVPVKLVCQMCKEEFQTEKSLKMHSELEHAEAMVDDDARKEATSRRK